MTVQAAKSAELWLASVEIAAEDASTAINAVAVAGRRNLTSGQASAHLRSYIENRAKPTAVVLDKLLGQPVIPVLNQHQLTKLLTVTAQITAATLGIDNALELTVRRGLTPLSTALEGVAVCLRGTKDLAQQRIAKEERRATGERLDPGPIKERLLATPESHGWDVMRAATAHLTDVEEMVAIMRQLAHEEAFELRENNPHAPLPSLVFEQRLRDDWQYVFSANPGTTAQWTQAAAQLRAEYQATGGRGAS